MDPLNVARAAAMHAAEIEWQLAPVAQLEAVEILPLTEPELLPHVAAMRTELRWLRHLLHEALMCISGLTVKLRRATQTIADQRRELQQRRAA